MDISKKYRNFAPCFKIGIIKNERSIIGQHRQLLRRRLEILGIEGGAVMQPHRRTRRTLSSETHRLRNSKILQNQDIINHYNLK